MTGTEMARTELARTELARTELARTELARTELALQLRGVRKTFEAENAPVRALRGVDLDVSRGEFVALTGPSGCGKSTLLNLAAGLDLADEGTIEVAGQEITGLSEDELARMRRQHIGIVFQFFNLLEGVTVLENVALAAIIAGRKRRAAESRARDLLDLLGLGQEVIELFRRLHASGQTIVLVTHDVAVAAAADRILRMLDGRLATAPLAGP